VRLLERSILGVVLAATLATLLTVAWNGLAPTASPLTFGLVFWAAFLAFYATLAAPGVLVLAVLGRVLKAPSLASIGVRVAAGAFAVLALGLNVPALRAVVQLPGPLRFRILTPLAGALAALGLAALSALEQKAAPRGLTLVAILAALGAFAPKHPPAAMSLELVRPTPPLLVVGLDGADWRYIEPLLARGELPHLAALRSSGAFGPLATMQPTLSPIVWTTMVTGRPPSEHGVSGFLMKTLRGVDVALPEPLLWPRATGATRLAWELGQRDLLREGPVGSEARRVPTLWNVATAHGSPMAVVHWWATTDPEPILGSLISPRVYYAATEGDGADRGVGALFPSRLYAEALSRVTRPRDVPFATASRYARVKEADWNALTALPLRHDGHLLQMLPYTLSLFETTRRLGLFALERGRADGGKPIDLLVLFRLVDMVCHKALVDSDLVQRPAGEADTSFTPAVAEAYRAVDAALGELVAASPGANVVVVSDHGFDVFEGRRGRRAGHDRAPDGIFIGAGPAFRAGRIDGVGVMDVMPLLLNLKGFPQAKAFVGRLPTQALTPEWLAARVPPPVASYDGVRRGRLSVREGAGRLDDAELEGLRALGYIN
jgi:hypothetical protein